MVEWVGYRWLAEIHRLADGNGRVHRFLINDQLRRDGPNTDIDRIVRSVKENGGRISNKLVGEFPMLADPQVASDLREAIASAFDTINPGPVANESARLR